MSFDSTTQLVNYFKQLLKQLDTKFASLDKQLEKVSQLESQLDRIEASIENLRAYNERFQSQISAEIKAIKSASQKEPEQTDFTSTLRSAFSSLSENQNIDQKPIPVTPPSFVSLPPQGPPPLDKYKSKPSSIQEGFSEPASIEEPLQPIVQPVDFTPTKPTKSISSQYGGMKETPILEALKEESLGDETYLEALNKKKKVKKQTLQAYLEKLEKVIKTSMPTAELNFQNDDFAGFVDKGLTVTHGIIEFLFVAYRQEFPDPSLDYYAKAKNLSGQALFKDVSLLEKLESIYGQIERGEKPVLAKPFLRGIHERILRLNEDFESRLAEAYGRL